MEFINVNYNYATRDCLINKWRSSKKGVVYGKIQNNRY